MYQEKLADRLADMGITMPQLSKYMMISEKELARKMRHNGFDLVEKAKLKRINNGTKWLIEPSKEFKRFENSEERILQQGKVIAA